MKDPKDKATIDALGKRRGRPPSGAALTNAEKQRLRRQRDADRFAAGELGEVTDSGLVELVSQAVKNNDSALVRRIATELIARIKGRLKSDKI